MALAPGPVVDAPTAVADVADRDADEPVAPETVEPALGFEPEVADEPPVPGVPEPEPITEVADEPAIPGTPGSAAVTEPEVADEPPDPAVPAPPRRPADGVFIDAPPVVGPPPSPVPAPVPPGPIPLPPKPAPDLPPLVPMWMVIAGVLGLVALLVVLLLAR